jgi:hypothetical protein
MLDQKAKWPRFARTQRSPRPSGMRTAIVRSDLACGELTAAINHRRIIV